jgi:hypothetical protein
MSDDLTERLRDRRVCSPAQNSCRNDYICDLAADRIEELEDENRLLRDAVYIDDLTVTMQANDRSKAMTVIGRALGFLDADMPTEAKTALRTTLAELKGETDE